MSVKSRRWYTGTLLTVKALFSVLGAFSRNRMRGVIPYVIALYVIALLVYLINLVSPLAPFVYSLF